VICWLLFLRIAPALAEMSDEEFAASFNEFQARGDKAKLMQLFEHLIDHKSLLWSNFKK
jgi:predicted sugar kinase